MNEPADDDLAVAIANAITGHRGDERPLVTSYVLIAGFIDDTGDRAIYTDTADNQRCHETLGLLAFGTAVESRRATQPDDS